MVFLLLWAVSAHAGSFNGSGTFVRSYNWSQDAANGIPITASRFDTEDDGFATGLSTCITKNGQTAITANIPMSGFTFLNLANSTLRSSPPTSGQVQDNVFNSGPDIGSVNAYALGTSNPPITAYTAGQVFWLVPGATNTASSTLNVDAIGAKTIKKNGSQDLVAGDLVSGTAYPFYYDGTNFQAITVSGTTQPSQIVSGTSSIAVISNTSTVSVTAGGVNSAWFTSAGLVVSGTITGPTLVSTSAGGVVSASIGNFSQVSATNSYPHLVSGTGAGSIVSSTFGYFNQVSATTGIALRGFAQGSDVALASGATATVTHGCGAVPRWTVVELTNTIADQGYTPNQVIQIPPYGYQGSNLGYGVASDSVSTTVKFGSAVNPISVINLGTGANAALTNADWTAHVKTGC